MKRLRGWGILLVYAVFVGGFFYQTIIFRKLPVPADTLVGLYHPWRDLYASSNPRGVPFKNFLITDPIRQQIPWRKISIDAWKNGRWPTWNPYTFMGVPLSANIQAAPFYPLNILFMVMDFSAAWTLLIILQPFFAGVFMYLYLKRQRMTSISAGVGSIAWALSGFAVSWMTWGTIMHTAVWLPLMLLSIDQLTSSHKEKRVFVRWSIILTIGMVMTLLAGHIQVAAYTMLLSVMYFAYRAAKPVLWISIGCVVSAGIAAAVLTAVQWVPLVRFIAESGRAGALESWKQAGWFLPLRQLVQFLVPDFFGNPATLNYWGEWNYGEFIGYIGVIPLVFALSVFFTPGLPRFFAVSAGIALGLMVSNPISRLPFLLHIPIFSVLQPTRLMVVLDFSLAVLAAIGFDRFIQGGKRSVKVSAGIFGVGFVILWGFILGSRMFVHDPQVIEHFAVTKRNLIMPTLLMGIFAAWLFAYSHIKKQGVKNAAAAILMAVIIFDLYRFGWKFTPFTPAEFFFPTTRIITYLQKQPKPFRIMSLDDRIMPPNVSSYFGIESIEGYDPITPMRYDAFLSASERGNADTHIPSGFNRIYTAHNIDSLLLPYFNVKYVLSLSEVKRPFLKEVMREGETRVYEYTKLLPRIYFPDKTTRVASVNDELSALFSPTGSVGVVDRTVHIVNIPNTGDETAAIEEYAPDHIRIKAQTASERLLVILNQYDPRWNMKLDGKPGSVIRVNYLFMGIIVPAGSHDIILSYR